MGTRVGTEWKGEGYLGNLSMYAKGISCHPPWSNWNVFLCVPLFNWLLDDVVKRHCILTIRGSSVAL